MLQKLYVYDRTSKWDKRQASGRFDAPKDLYTLPVNSLAELKIGLVKLLSAGKTFDRALFQTHGNSGCIFIAGKEINSGVLTDEFAGTNLHRLFPRYTRMYFDGCNVAEGNDGIQFLTIAGTIFLQASGGVTLGFTSGGLGLPGWIPFIGGHTIHPTGELRQVLFGPGGVVLPPPPVEKEQPWRGHPQ